MIAVESGDDPPAGLMQLMPGTAAYNAGEDAVMRVPPYAETRAYVTRVRAAYERLSRTPGVSR
jgi:soluble lytic murein transglycosylase-like protein